MKGLQSSRISFEFFPPKTSEGSEKLAQAVKELSAYQPEFYSVTYGAGGSTRAGTEHTVNMVRTISGAEVAPHLTCVGSSVEEIIEVIAKYKQQGIKRIVALRGDLPSGMGNTGELRYASELVTLIRHETGNAFFIEVAAYPEFHPQAKSAHDDVMNLKRKYEAGANRGITQFFFNADAYFYLLDDCHKHGIAMPVVPGIMPITQFHRLASFADTCGAEIPRWLRGRLRDYGDDVESIQKFGQEFIAAMCRKLLEGGAPGLHFYTLNKAEPTIKLLADLNVEVVAKAPLES